MEHVTSVRDFTTGDLNSLFERAASIKRARAEAKKGNREAWLAINELLRGFLATELFYASSTRTYLSSAAAMYFCGGGNMGTEHAESFSSITKGETLEDTIQVIAMFCDVIILRHTERGAAKRAALVSEVPVINAGDGEGEHPTQALLDLFTIKENHGGEELTATFVGDLKYGRTVHSLAYLFAQIQGTNLATVRAVNFVGPESLQIPDAVTGRLREHGILVERHYALTHAIAAASDIMYMTRSQSERQAENERVETFVADGEYALRPELADCMPADGIIMHPLPRGGELPKAVDGNQRASYFEQAGNGLFVRMALLLELLLK